MASGLSTQLTAKIGEHIVTADRTTFTKYIREENLRTISTPSTALSGSDTLKSQLGNWKLIEKTFKITP